MGTRPEGDEPSVLDHLAGKLDGRLDVGSGQAGIPSPNLLIGHSTFQQLQDRRHHDPRALEAGLAVANGRINSNVVSPIEPLVHSTGSITGTPLIVNEPIGVIAWDRIIAIEYTGQEPVYDIEIEGTHNVLANGILAHNTYLEVPLPTAAAAPIAKDISILLQH
jgi:hypothetical protein